MIKQQHLNGAVSELKAMEYYLSKGYEIFTPLLSQSRADFIAASCDDCKKVQVKTATWSRAGNHKYLQVRLTDRTGIKRMYEDGDFDEMAIIDENDIWIAPWKDIKGLTSLCLDGTKPGYKSQSELYNPDSWKQEQQIH